MSDIYYIALWWIMLFIFGVVSVPVSWHFFKNFIDRGYGLAKSIGILSVSYFVFLLSISRFLAFTNLTIIIVFLLYFGFNYFIFTKHKKEILNDLRDSLRVIIIQEILFGIGLVLWSLVRSYQPDILGLEKFMDYGFINSLLRTKYLPGKDIWFAGESINYYWFGHFIVAALTKLSNIPSSITYNLSLATIMGLVLTNVFSLTASLTKRTTNKLKLTLAAGLLSAILVTFGGNFHPQFFKLRQSLDNQKIIKLCKQDPTCVYPKLDNKDYWYPDATRFIGYDPDINDKTIHEFPIYSYVVSDLHAHLINLPFVILFLSLLYVSVLGKIGILERSLSMGFLLGIFFMTNTWDVGNYLLTTGFVFGGFALASFFTKKKPKLKDFMSEMVKVVRNLMIIALIAIVTLIPFYVNFKSIAQGVDFVKSHTPLWQLVVLWGFPGILTFVFGTQIFKEFKERKQISKTDLFVLMLLASSWTLIAIPEIIYVKDIYIASHHRANTMFKLTYQAFVMTYTLSGYIAIKFVTSVRNSYAKVVSVILFGLIFSSIISYSKIATNSYYMDFDTYKGLQGDTWVKSRYPNIANTIQWFRENVDGEHNILEAPGDSYTDFNIISSYTGLSTVSGWYVHEWLWRGDSSYPAARVNDIDLIYQSSDLNVTVNLLKKYDVEYVIVGQFERQKYPGIYESKFESIGKKVFTSGDTQVYKIN